MELPSGPVRLSERSARLLTRFGVLAVAAVTTFLFVYHYRLWLRVVGEPGGILEASIDAVLAGDSEAPFQYRTLVPHMIRWLRDGGFTTFEATVILDLVSLAAGGILGIKLFLRAGRGWAIAPAAAFVALMAVGAAWFAKPETYPSYALYVGATLLFVAGTRWPLVALAVPMCFMRTDLVVCLGLSVLAAAWAGGTRRDVAVGAALVALGAAATVGLALHYPVGYGDEFGAVQLRYNLRIDVLLVGIALVAVPLAPLLLGGGRQLFLSGDGRAAVPLLVPLLVLVAATAVVGRLDEVRIFLPVAWSAALGSVVLWEAALGREPELEREAELSP